MPTMKTSRRPWTRPRPRPANWCGAPNSELRQGAPREIVPRATLQRLLLAFADAMQRGDFHGLRALLSDDAELIGDGGGRATSFARMVGGKRLAQLLYAGNRRFRDALRTEVVQVNGQWALLRFIDGVLESVQSYETDGERLTGSWCNAIRTSWPASRLRWRAK